VQSSGFAKASRPFAPVSGRLWTMEEPSFTVQQKVLQLVVHRIVVEDHQVIIEHVVPTGPVRWQPEQQPCENLVHTQH
jgi:hypothetical protein